MKDFCYLVFDRGGIRRMVKKAPKLNQNERVVRVEVVVDDAAFTPPPVLKTTIAVGVEHVGLPTVTAEPAVLALPGEREERAPAVPAHAPVNDSIVEAGEDWDGSMAGPDRTTSDRTDRNISPGTWE